MRDNLIKTDNEMAFEHKDSYRIRILFEKEFNKGKYSKEKLNETYEYKS
jgi:hypothetical protein